MGTRFSSIIRLRRDNDFNYKKIENTFIPDDGEVCLVDTNKGLKAKVGDGSTTFANLIYTDKAIEDQLKEIIVKGYYYDEKFYKDELHTEEISGYTYKLFINIPENKVYSYINDSFEPITSYVPSATSNVSGIMKLYNEHGQATDGTMTQKAITDADSELSDRIDLKVTASADPSTETLFLRFN